MYETLGEEEYYKCLKEYVKTFAFDEVSTEEFVEYWKSKGIKDDLIDEYGWMAGF